MFTSVYQGGGLAAAAEPCNYFCFCACWCYPADVADEYEWEGYSWWFENAWQEMQGL